MFIIFLTYKDFMSEYSLKVVYNMFDAKSAGKKKKSFKSDSTDFF